MYIWKRIYSVHFTPNSTMKIQGLNEADGKCGNICEEEKTIKAQRFNGF